MAWRHWRAIRNRRRRSARYRHVPLVVRLDGTNSEQGLELLEQAGIEGLEVEQTMLGAAERVVELAEGSG